MPIAPWIKKSPRLLRTLILFRFPCTTTFGSGRGDLPRIWELSEISEKKKQLIYLEEDLRLVMQFFS